MVPEILRTKVGVFVDLYRKTEQIRQQGEERVALAREQTARMAAEEATRRSHFLAEVTSVLARSLDHETTVQEFLRLVVPHLADFAGITLVRERGAGLEKRAGVDRASGKEWRSARFAPCRLPARKPPTANCARPCRRVVRSGQPEISDGLMVPYPRVSDAPVTDDAGTVTACAAAAAAQGRTLHSVALLPLRARGRTLGVLTLATWRPRRRFTPADLR